MLFIAALFHDIGKGRGGDHSEIGAREVRRFCRQHGVAREDAKLIEFLVREHLTMSRGAEAGPVRPRRHHRLCPARGQRAP